MQQFSCFLLEMDTLPHFVEYQVIIHSAIEINVSLNEIQNTCRQNYRVPTKLQGRSYVFILLY